MAARRSRARAAAAVGEKPLSLEVLEEHVEALSQSLARAQTRLASPAPLPPPTSTTVAGPPARSDPAAQSLCEALQVPLEVSVRAR